VNNTNNPLRLNIGYLYNKPIGTSREVPVDIEKIEIEDLLIKDLRSLVRISRTREGLLLQVDGEAQIETVCVKCLVKFFQPIRFEFEELYQFPSRHREETDLILPMDGYIDLRSLYREYLILAMPIKPVCSSSCKGLCAVCGANLNKKICEHHPELMTEKGVTEG
jgi:uncharacterized protein